MKTTLALLSLAFLMGTPMSLSAETVDPSPNAADPAAERTQPTMDNVAWGTPKAGVNTHAAGEFREIPLHAIDPNKVGAYHFDSGVQKKSNKMLRCDDPSQGC
jgi:hypothetical protein